MGWKINENGSYCQSAPRSCSCPETISLPIIIASGVSSPRAYLYLWLWHSSLSEASKRERNALQACLGQIETRRLTGNSILIFHSMYSDENLYYKMKNYISRIDKRPVWCGKMYLMWFRFEQPLKTTCRGWWNVVLEGTGSKYNPQHEPERRNEIWT